jgi:hypothetical protein
MLIAKTGETQRTTIVSLSPTFVKHFVTDRGRL